MKPITDSLRALRGGVFVDEASAELAKVVNAVTETGKPGKLTIELTLSKAGRGSSALVIRDKITSKLPSEGSIETLLFATPEGALVTADPRQQALELRTVTTPVAEPKVVNED